MHVYLFSNNKLIPNTQPIIGSASKALRYGELVFETIKVAHNHIYFAQAHYGRLLQAATILKFTIPVHFTFTTFTAQIHALLSKNKLSQARVRYTVYKGEGGLYEHDPKAWNTLIETYQLPIADYELNSNGLDICIYNTMHKPTDTISNYKTGNHLIYNMAALYAKEQHCNEALILNVAHNLCDGTISNLIIIKDNILYTPPLHDGCISGILRNYLCAATTVVEQSLTVQDLLDADEVLLTNTVRGLQWVKQYGDKQYTNKVIASMIPMLHFEQLKKYWTPAKLVQHT